MDILNIGSRTKLTDPKAIKNVTNSCLFSVINSKFGLVKGVLIPLIELQGRISFTLIQNFEGK